MEIILDLPDKLVKDAQEFGLLKKQTLTKLLQTEVDRLVNELVNEEIHAYRAEKRARENSEQA
jgi:hypothetical protein